MRSNTKHIGTGNTIQGDKIVNLEKIVVGNQVIALVHSNEIVIENAQSALDLLMSAKYELGTKNIAIDKNLVNSEFFILSTGLAGEILQKYVNYGGRIAIYGDYSGYTSKPLHDFMYESNKGKDVFFVSGREEAVNLLASR